MTSHIHADAYVNPSAGGEGGLDPIAVLLAGEVDGDGLAGVGGLAVARCPLPVARCSGDGPSCIGPRWAARRDRRGRWVLGWWKELAGRSRPSGRRRSRRAGLSRSLPWSERHRRPGQPGAACVSGQCRWVDARRMRLPWSSCAPGGGEVDGVAAAETAAEGRPELVEHGGDSAGAVGPGVVDRQALAGGGGGGDTLGIAPGSDVARRSAARSRGRRALWFAALCLTVIRRVVGSPSHSPHEARRRSPRCGTHFARCAGRARSRRAGQWLRAARP